MIGEGAYGSVYKAIHKKSGRLVAIKVVPSTGEISSLQKEIQILKVSIIFKKGMQISIYSEIFWFFL